MVTLKKRNAFNERPSLFTDVMNVLYRSFKSPYNRSMLRRSRLITETVKATETTLITIFLKILQEDCDVDLIVRKNLFVKFKVINALAINLLTEELESRSDPVTYTIYSFTDTAVKKEISGKKLTSTFAFVSDVTGIPLQQIEKHLDQFTDSFIIYFDGADDNFVTIFDASFKNRFESRSASDFIVINESRKHNFVLDWKDQT